MFMMLSQVISRVHPVHLTNAGQRQIAADPQTDLGCESACRLLYGLRIPSPCHLADRRQLPARLRCSRDAVTISPR